jgi:hypothetical protein
MPALGFVLMASVIFLEPRLQIYMEIFSGSYLSYFIILWIYSITTEAATSPVLGVSIGGRQLELMLYTSSGIGLVLGTLATRYQIIQRLKAKIIN